MKLNLECFILLARFHWIIPSLIPDFIAFLPKISVWQDEGVIIQEVKLAGLIRASVSLVQELKVQNRLANTTVLQCRGSDVSNSEWDLVHFIPACIFVYRCVDIGMCTNLSKTKRNATEDPACSLDNKGIAQ